MPAEIHDLYDSILILDFGSQVSFGNSLGMVRDSDNGFDMFTVLSLDHPKMP